MNLFNLLSDLEKADPEALSRLDSRRAAFRHLSGFGKKVALSAVPLGLSTIFSKAYGQGSTAIAEVLNYALKLEHLESEFYRRALDQAQSPDLVFPTGVRAAIQTISSHENAHVNLLRDTIIGLSATPDTYTAASFDFTAGGTYADVFSNYSTFLAVAQALEDTGVRAYKGRAAELMSNDTILRIALTIHSAEARHAAHIRMLRRTAGAPDIKPWITLSEANGVPPTVYAGEEETTQAGHDVTTFAGIGGNLSGWAASEAFDEPLTPAEVNAIVSPFIV